MKNIQIRFPFKVICVNDKNRPEEMPLSKWPKEGETYTATGLHDSHGNNSKGFYLAEFDTKGMYPYQSYNVNRFDFHPDEIDIFERENEQIELEKEVMELI